MTDVYAAIEVITLQEGQPVSAVCDVLEVSRSAYHAWLARDPSVREERDAELSPLVHDIFWLNALFWGLWFDRGRFLRHLSDVQWLQGDGEICCNAPARRSGPRIPQIDTA